MQTGLRWLDPCSKSGVFLRRSPARLLVGLADGSPTSRSAASTSTATCSGARSITEMTGQHLTAQPLLLARRTGEHSVVRFDDAAGNLPFVPAPSTTFRKATLQDLRRAGGLERGERRENYAYSFIHGAYPTKEMHDMKFDVIVGNPPYQIDDGGHTPAPRRSTTLRRAGHRDESALRTDDHAVALVRGGKGLDEYREPDAQGPAHRALVDYPKLYDCFPGVKIRGGVSYSSGTETTTGRCTVQTMWDGKPVGHPITRDLGAYDVLVRRNEAVSHPRQGARPSRANDRDARLHASPKPFGLRPTSTAPRHQKRAQKPGEAVRLTTHLMGRPLRHPAKRRLDRRLEGADLPAYRARALRSRRHVLGEPIIAGPGEACTETYLVAGSVQDQTRRPSTLPHTCEPVSSASLSRCASPPRTPPATSTHSCLTRRRWTGSGRTTDAIRALRADGERDRVHRVAQCKEMPAPRR